MKAKELMLGDWVRISDDDTDEYFDAQIKGVDFLDNVYAPIPGEEKPCPFSIDCVEPIPLTPEILEKNGFKRIEGNRFYPNPRWVFAKDGSRDGVVIEIVLYEQPINGVNILTKINTQSSKDYGVNDIHNCDIEYVHQLQQALRLCKIDKEIVVC